MTTMIEPDLKTITKILHKATGWDYKPEAYDVTGPAKIHYTLTETVEYGTAHHIWGMTTSERDEDIDHIMTVDTVAELLDTLRNLEDRIDGAAIEYVELSDTMCDELTTMWNTMFGDAEVHVRHGFSPLV